jgi:membrane-bound serine protease (ClpP class)
VAPAGARAASAGTYITYAAHVAAMAPATNLGAATPVPLGGLPDFKPQPPQPSPDEGADEKASGTGNGNQAHEGPSEQRKPATGAGDAMERKIVNDAVAYLRGLAQLRGRNAEWAERAVREGASLSAEEALAQDVIDLVAADVDALLAALNGREVRIQDTPRSLDIGDAPIRIVEPDWRSRLLAIITNPNIVYILLLLGIYGLFFELANPGYVLPGVVGAISLLLALYALNVLPVNYAGLALILVGVAFMAGEVFMPSFGSLGIGGLIAFVIGSVILFDSEAPLYRVSLPVIVVVALLSAALFMGIIGMALKLHRRRSVSGIDDMIGSLGVVLEDFEDTGRVRTHGETWLARSQTALKRGQQVRVTALDGLTLIVEVAREEN